MNDCIVAHLKGFVKGGEDLIEVVKPSEDISVEDCIVILENIRERGRLYDEYLPYPKEYCEQLAGIEALAIDKVIGLLRNPE